MFRKKTRGQVIGAELQEGFAHIGVAATEAGRLAAEQLGPRVAAAREAAGPKLDAAQKAGAPPRSPQPWRPPHRRSRPPATPSAPGGGRPRGDRPPRGGRLRGRGARVASAVSAAQDAAVRAAADLGPRVEAAQKAAQKALKDDVVPRLEAAQTAAVAYAAPRVTAAREGDDAGPRERPRDAGGRGRQCPQRDRGPAGRTRRHGREVDPQGPQDGQEGAEDGRQEAPASSRRRRRRPPSRSSAGPASSASRGAGRGCSPPSPWVRRGCRRPAAAQEGRTTWTPAPAGDGPVPSYREDPVPSSPSTAGKTVSDAEFARRRRHPGRLRPGHADRADGRGRRGRRRRPRRGQLRRAPASTADDRA